MMNKKLLVTLIAGIIIISGVFVFNFFSKEKRRMPVARPDVEKIENIVMANNQFAIDLYLKNKGQQEENVFFSPYSLSVALAMVYEGAKNETAQEIENVFYFPKDNILRRESYFNLQNWLSRKDIKHEFNIANALWAEKNFYFLNEYFEIISQHYQGLIENLDFIKKPEQSRERINKWVEFETKEKIKNLIPQGIINDSTRLILTNAVYFKGEWLEEFNQINTQKDNFYISSRESVKVNMMQRLDEDALFPYYATENFQIMEMPYDGEEISMFVLLPKEKDLKELEKKLTLASLDLWQENLEEQRVKVYFPKFKIETKYFLKSVLDEMGMATCFTDQADFSGITGQRDLLINEIIHQAFVEVDEKGTEAAAATGVVMDLTSVPSEPIPVFRADRPFIFLIQEKETKTILFMGRLVNPEQ